jgi:alpha-tubulin suppressor-like RCC1 family protein
LRTRSIGACFCALALTTVVLVGEQPVQAGVQVGALRVSHSRAMTNEYLRFSGRLPSERVRVVLQEARPNGWARVAVKRSTSTGRFAFRIRNSSQIGVVETYRVVAPRQSRLPHRQVTPRRNVRTVRQVGALYVPTVVSTGTYLHARAQMSPVRPGRDVIFQRRSSSGWKNWAAGSEGANGFARVSVRAKRQTVYPVRAVAVAENGASSYPTQPEEVLSTNAAVIVTDRLPDAFVGEPYDTRLKTADIGDGTWQLVDGTLPTGLGLDAATGEISGTPEVASGNTLVTVQFVDTEGQADQAILPISSYDVPGSETGSTWRNISTDGFTTCGSDFDGTTSCWGWNGSGEVGDGTKENPQLTRKELPGSWASVVPEVTVCGIQTDATGWCWAWNDEGQVGDGTISDNPTPHQVPGSWTSLETNLRVTCGIQADKSGWCWGATSTGGVGDGQEGYDPSYPYRTTPYELPGTWLTLRPGLDNVGPTCGIQTDHTGWCWGPDFEGAVGDGGTAPEQIRRTPYRLPGLWSSLENGGDTTCGIGLDSTGWCWGLNGDGEVGNGSGAGVVSSPSQLPGLWRTLKPGVGGTCGIQIDDTAWCWGSNEHGEAGDLTGNDQLTPQQLPGRWRTLVSSVSHSVFAKDHTRCGVQLDGTGWCWGLNNFGQLGDGTTQDQGTPVQVPGSWREILPRDRSTCGIQMDGSGWCWGDTTYAQVGNGDHGPVQSVPYQLAGIWRDLGTGIQPAVTCGIQTDSSGWCWGTDYYGQVGDGIAGEGYHYVAEPYRLP